MASITKFLDPKNVPDVTGDDLDMDKAIQAVGDLTVDSDTVEVDLSKDSKSKISGVVLPAKKESVDDSGDAPSEVSPDDQEKSADSSAVVKDSKDSSEEVATASEKSDSAGSDEIEKVADSSEEVTSGDSNTGQNDSDSGAKKESDGSADDASQVKEDSSEQVDSVKEPESMVASDNAEVSSEVDHGESDLDADNQQPAPLLKLVSEYDYHNTKVYETPAGARLVYVNNPSDLCFAAFEFKVGSFYEDDSNRGISHLLEHLMFNGCPGMSSREFAEKMDKLGMSINAYTDRMLTCYHFSGLKSNFISAFDLYANLIKSFTATQESLDKERGVVLSEISMRNDDNWNVLHETVMAQAFRQHPASHPVIGYEDIIENINLDQVKDWYSANYNVKNLTVYLVGDFPEEDLVFVAGKMQLFSDGNKNPDPVITDAMVLPFYKNVISRKEGATQTLVDSSLLFKNEAFNIYELMVLTNVLGGSMSSYLWNAFREERSIAYQVGSYTSNMDPEHLHVHLYAGLNDSDDAELAKSLFKEAFTYSKAITEDEFNKGLNIVLAYLLRDQETQVGMLDVLREVLYMKLNPDDYVTTFKNLTFDSYQSFVEQIDPENMVTGILYPATI